MLKRKSLLVLAAVVFAALQSASRAVADPIISLIGEESPGEPAQSAAYGHNTIPTLVLSGSNGNYAGAADTGLSATIGDVEVEGFNPAGDNEIYALELAGANDAAVIANVISEINANNTGVVAELPTADVAASYLGYQVELVARIDSRSSDQDLGFDLSSLAENLGGVGATVRGEMQSLTPGTITLAAVAAVPEPASFALLMGASGLLLGRRKRNV
jgi:hypothetical protein